MLLVIPICILFVVLLYRVTDPEFCIMAIILPIAWVGFLLRIGEPIVQDQVRIYDSYIEIIKPGKFRFLKSYVTTIRNQDIISVGRHTRNKISIRYHCDDHILKWRPILINYKMTKKTGEEELDEVFEINGITYVIDKFVHKKLNSVNIQFETKDGRSGIVVSKGLPD